MAFGNNETGGHLPVNPKPEGPTLAFGRSSLTQGLVFAQDYNPASFGSTHKDLLGASSGAYTGTSANRGPFGWERTFLSSTDVDNYTSGAAVNGLTTLSVEFIFKANVDTFSTIYGKGSNASVGDGQIFFCVNYDDTSHCISIGAGYNTTSIGFHDTGANFPANQFTHCVVTWDATTLLSPLAAIYKNGQSLALTQEGTGATGTRVTDNTVLQVGNFPGQNFGATADIVYLRVWNRVLLPQEVQALAQNPWIIYRQPPSATAVTVPSGTTHDATGALTGPGTTIAGTATRFRAHPSTGALTGPGSSVAGTAVRFRAHPSSGALTGPGSVIAGTAARSGSPVTHPSSGALVGPGASISGQAARQSRIDPGWPLVEGIRKRRRKRDEEIDAAWAQRNVERQQLKDQIRQAMQGPQPQHPAAKIETPRPAMARKIRDSEDDDIEILLLYA